jgi:hypothetical protein
MLLIIIKRMSAAGWLPQLYFSMGEKFGGFSISASGGIL